MYSRITVLQQPANAWSKKCWVDVYPRYIPALHEWEEFLDLFGRMFGLHDEQPTSQAALDNAIQKSGEMFADFLTWMVPEKLLRKLDWLAPKTTIPTWGENQQTLPQMDLVLQQEQDLRKMQTPQMQRRDQDINKTLTQAATTVIEEEGPVEAKAAFMVSGEGEDKDVALILELEALEMEARFEKQGNDSETQAED
ncbi:hypothetical protein BT96DRAFT_950875 [Gymnopus androsaceus JB14]|uniref:Uncharacterized protein n=1 Tax=Gymnopus androsaceus JB14 TaxID=1447944 RepID=A0A6A4GF15_9AGAR|nr:hypothetical protein BT96DRAFT_950875 [Gymnopus androsaceus JB14]